MRLKGEHAERGVAAVEFAIVLPILLILVFGIVEFSSIIYNKALITNASREGARAGMVADLNDAERVSAARVAVKRYLSTFFLSVEPAAGLEDGDISVDLTGVSSFGHRLISVTVDYDYVFFIMPDFISSLSSGLTLIANTVMQFED